MARVGPGGPPLTRGPATGPGSDGQDPALVPDEQPQQLDEPGAVESTRGAVGRRLNGDRIADASDGEPLLAPQLRAEHGPCRAPGGAMRGGRHRRTRDRRPAAGPPAAAALPRAPPRPARLYARAARTRPAAFARLLTGPGVSRAIRQRTR